MPVLPLRKVFITANVTTFAKLTLACSRVRVYGDCFDAYQFSQPLRDLV